MPYLNSATTFFVFLTLALLYIIAGYFNGMFRISQVLAKWHQPGIALAIHGGVWSDVFILPPFFAYFVGMLQGDWNTTHIKYAGAIGFALTLGNHLLLMFTQDKPDPMGWKREWWSTTIAIHFIYMWGAITLLALILLWSPSATADMITMTCIVVGVHMYFGLHLPLGMLNRVYRSPRMPEFLTYYAMVMNAVIWAVLAGLAWHAAGFYACLCVVTAGGALSYLAYDVSKQTIPVLQIKG